MDALHIGSQAGKIMRYQLHGEEALVQHQRNLMWQVGSVAAAFLQIYRTRAAVIWRPDRPCWQPETR